MYNTKKFLLSIGAALAATKLFKAISRLEFDDVLGTVGFERRRDHTFENMALVGLGAVVGAGTALLVAPMTGRETRQRIGEGASKLGNAAKTAIREHGDDIFSSLSGSSETPQHS